MCLIRMAMTLALRTLMVIPGAVVLSLASALVLCMTVALRLPVEGTLEQMLALLTAALVLQRTTGIVHSRQWWTSSATTSVRR